jgi:XTP/dITP diphosphohydrolase
MTPSRILVATTSRGKIREIAAMLADLPIETIGLDDLPPLTEPVEDGATFAENATKKALHYAGLTGELTLADDSGLEVDALQGAPGVYSARYGGEPRDDNANNAKLVAELQSIPNVQRTARFRCVLVAARGDCVLAVTEGAVEGRIIDEPRGTNGFGYDPHFFVPELGKTTAELDPEYKNRISHRGKAVRAMKDRLIELLGAD